MKEIAKQLQFNVVGIVRLIAQGWRQPTMGYACSGVVNTIDVDKVLAHFMLCNARYCLSFSALISFNTPFNR